MRVKCRNVSISPLIYLLFFPYHADFYADRWIERDTGNIGSGKVIGHAGVEKAAIFSGFYKLQGGVDLAAPHNDIGCVAIHLKTHFQDLILDGVSIEKDQLLFRHIFCCD